MESEPSLWVNMTAAEIEQARLNGAVAVIPIGAIEQHGTHLPVDTDIRVGNEIALELSRRDPRVLVLPPIWWGLSGALKGFPGILSLRAQTMLSLLRDLCDSLVDESFRKIVLLVGHGPNRPLCAVFVSEYMEERLVPILQIGYLPLAREPFQRLRKTSSGDSHAGELETSIMMHLCPDLVRKDDAPVHLVDAKVDFGVGFAGGDVFAPGDAALPFMFKETFPGGVMGDPTVANAETGRAVFDAMVARIAEIVEEYRALEE